MTATFTFVLLLPCSIWLLGSVLGLLDRSDDAATLRRIAWRATPFVAAGLLLGDDARWPALAALLTALGVHVTAFMGTRALVRRGWLIRWSTSPRDD